MGITFIQDNSIDIFDTFKSPKEINFISLDTETTGLDPYINDLLTYQIKIGDEILVFDSRKISKELSSDLFKTIRDLDIKVLLHNATFDLKFIYTKFGVLLTNVHDTMYTETMLTAGLGQVLTSLDSLVEKYCGVIIDKAERETFLTTDLVSPLTQNQINYAATDVLYLEEIYKEQMKRVKEDKLSRVYDLEMKLVPVVATMELNGITLNKEAWNKLTEQATVTTETLKRELKETLLAFVSYSCNGLQLAEKLHIPVSRKRDQQALELITDSGVLKTWVNENFNLNSHLQLKTLLELAGIKVTDTNEKTLKKFGRNKVIDLLLEYREAVKKLTTYGNNIVDLINPITNKIHTHYLNIGTATGRFASNNPNMQNIPSQSEYREAFEAMDGFSLVAMDYSQQEIRLVGAISNEKKIIDAYKQNIDLHKETASLIFNKPPEEVTKDERYFGKTLLFAILYGTTEYGLKYNLQISLEKAQEMIKAFYNGYPSLSKFKSLAEEKILELGYSVTPLGRRRYWNSRPLFSDTYETQRYFDKMKREGFNFLIQGSGADITKIAMCNMFYNNPFGDKFRILLQVHDEIVAEIHDSILKEAVEFMKDQMLNAEQPFLGQVPAAIDFKVAKKWSK